MNLREILTEEDHVYIDDRGRHWQIMHREMKQIDGSPKPQEIFIGRWISPNHRLNVALFVVGLNGVVRITDTEGPFGSMEIRRKIGDIRKQG